MNRDARDTLSFKLKVSFRGKLGRKLLSLVGRPFVRLLHFDRLRGFYLDVLSDADEDSLEKGLAVLNVALEISDDSLARIPTEGPAIVVANHPFGGIEALILATVLRSVRDDVRVFGDQLMKRTPNVKDTFILPDPLETSRPARTSRNTCIEWVKDGGLLALFPAREISHIDLKRRSIADPKWRRSAARMIRRTKAPVLPMFFSGYNGVLFQLLGLVHYRLSGVVLPRELFSRRRRDIQIRTGSLIPFDKLKAFFRDKNMTEYLRMRTYILNNPAHGHPGAKKARRAPEDQHDEFEEIAPPGDPERIADEVRNLRPDQTLAKVGEFAVMLASAPEIPDLLREIGRLREITFREVGEGTGNSRDLDKFDQHYAHLFVWNKRKNEVVGAYRLGLTDEILERSGEKGLYTTTLFKFKPGMLQRINPAVEMGRSFVRPEYQRSYAPLMLLWKGVGEFVLRHPRYKLLFGPVSINDEYNSTSRQLMIRFLKQNKYLREMAKLVKPKTPLKRKAFKGWNPKSAGNIPDNVAELSALISDIETDQKGVPILLKQYLRLGGKLLGCNIDPDFSNVLDALLLIDLTETDPKILIRYMGKKRAEEFLAYHDKSLDPVAV